MDGDVYIVGREKRRGETKEKGEGDGEGGVDRGG